MTGSRAAKEGYHDEPNQLETEQTLNADTACVCCYSDYRQCVWSDDQVTYQGKLGDNGNPASGQYDFQFKVFDTALVDTGTQIGSAVTVTSVEVTAGVFTVDLDFGASVFTGADRYLEIAVKPTSSSTFTTLAPRKLLTSTPYAIRSAASMAADGLSVACAGCVTSAQIQTVQGSQVTGS